VLGCSVSPPQPGWLDREAEKAQKLTLPAEEIERLIAERAEARKTGILPGVTRSGTICCQKMCSCWMRPAEQPGRSGNARLNGLQVCTVMIGCCCK